MKTNLSLVNTRNMKRLVNASHTFTHVSVNIEDNDKYKETKEFDPRDEIGNNVSNYDKYFQGSQELQHEDSLHASIKDPILQCVVESEIDPLVNIVPVKKRENIYDSFSLATISSFLLLVYFVWLVVVTVNTNILESKRMIESTML